MRTQERTITEFIIEEQRKNPGATGGFTALLNDIRLACKRIGNVVGKGALAEPSAPLRERAHAAFVRTNEPGGHLAAMASSAAEGLCPIPPRYPRGRYLLAFDPLCGARGLEVNAVAGSLFSVLRAPESGQVPEERDFLQPGSRQVCAGYAIYGPATLLVLALESGVNGFTLDREIGEFMLTHPGMRVPEETSELAIDTSDARQWEPAVKRYVDECLAGPRGARGRDFTLRGTAPLVAAAHRILLRGGAYVDPLGVNEQLFAANPVGWVIERAGGRASAGKRPLLEAVPAALHERTPLVFGSRAEVERVERYYRDYNEREYDAPLFGTRGLFRASAEV
jgi:fructose-1,6-bisphosphatase I/sedoheptulose-1,7-bisphosphatase